MNESEKKMEMMVATLQTMAKDSPNEDGETSCNEEGEDDRKGGRSGKKHSLN